MVLVIGGKNQGKLAYVRSNWEISPDQVISGENLTAEKLSQAVVINHLHLWVRQGLEQQPALTEDALLELLTKDPQKIILCDEVGCGVVPMEQSERAYREKVGRLCCRLAKQADTVIRVCCGIGTVIKGDSVND